MLFRAGCEESGCLTLLAAKYPEALQIALLQLPCSYALLARYFSTRRCSQVSAVLKIR